MNYFIDDIGTSLLCLNPPEDLDALVNCYDSTLSSVLNQHAPLQSRSPWFNNDIKNGPSTVKETWPGSYDFEELALD